MSDDLKFAAAAVIVVLVAGLLGMTASACYQQGWNDGHRNGYHFTDGGQ